MKEMCIFISFQYIIIMSFRLLLLFLTLSVKIIKNIFFYRSSKILKKYIMTLHISTCGRKTIG